ncbi:MAG: thioredoxin [Bacteroidota bacterium]
MNVAENKPTFAELIQSEVPVLVDFYADWCGPCVAMAPVLKELAAEVGDTAKIVKINVDKNPQLAGQYGIQGIPAFILFKNGEILWRQAGMMPKGHLKQVISQFVAEGVN